MIDDKEEAAATEEKVETGAEAEETTEETAEEGQEPEKETEELDAGADDEDDGIDDTTSEAEKPSKPVGRAQARIQKLSAERDAERADKEKLIHERAVAQAQLEQLRAQQRELQSASERRAEEERLALLDPQERATYQANQQIRNLEWRLNQMEIQRGNDQDRANFQAKAAHDETYGKYADQVEQMYQEGLQRGVSASREDLHSYILGKELKKDLAAKTSEKRKSASKRIDSVTAKPASARGDVAGSKKGKSEEDRLRGVLI
jgi:hypothetical protein